MLIDELARAKVNLTLRILGRRPSDGYHLLQSVVAFASLGDGITLDTTREPSETVSGAFAPQLPTEVLIARTLQLVAERAPQLRLGAVHLEKRLPVAAGIGGGSADAGAVLRAIARANPETASEVDWLGIARELGADVPVCFSNVLTVMSGIGEVLSPLGPMREPLGAVLVNPQVAVPADKTARVFRALNAGPVKEVAAVPPLVTKAEFLAEIARSGNDLEQAALSVVPEVGGVLTALRAIPGCQVAHMSGAGPTCFGIFDDAAAAASSLRMFHPGWWIEPVTLS